MSPDPICDAILTRIKADTTTGGLYVGNAFTIFTGWYAIDAPPTLNIDSMFPYGVYNLQWDYDNTLTSDGCKYVVDFTLYDKAERGLANISKGLARLYGNAMATAGRIPTYGFNRHPLVLSTDPTINPLALVGNGGLAWQGGRTDPTSTSVITGSVQYNGFASVLASSP